jgi:hypothetical protein
VVEEFLRDDVTHTFRRAAPTRVFVKMKA